MGLATAAVLVLAAPAAAVVWPEDEPVTATASTPTEEKAPASPRVAPSVGAESWEQFEDEPATGEQALAPPLAVRARPSEKARLVDLGRSEQVVVTGETRGRWAEVVVDDETRWVKRAALADTGTERGAGQEARRSPQVAGRKPVAGGAASKPQPNPATTSAPETAPTGAAAAPAPAQEPASPPASAASDPVPSADAVSEPTPAPSTTEEPVWDDPTPAAEPTEDPAQDPVIEPGATLPPELEPVPDLAAVLE